MSKYYLNSGCMALFYFESESISINGDFYLSFSDVLQLAAVINGSRSSERKKASSRLNGLKGGRPRKSR